MVECPQCGTACNLEEATDGRCHICGAFLPQQTPEPPSVTPEAPQPPTAPPPGSTPDKDDTGIGRTIKLRKLSEQNERRLRSSWQSASQEFQSPDASIKTAYHPDSHRGADKDDRDGDQSGDDSSGLHIGKRSVGKIEDENRADYELMEVLGEGGMGTVWLARQSAIDRRVAIKIPRRDISLEGGQFIQEVLVTGRLDHPNIVPVYDFARKEDTEELFYSMKVVEGDPWNECMHGKKGTRKLTREENVEVLMKVCDAIRFAHDRDIIHCDIKPHNIMVGYYGEVSVMDFGSSLQIDAQSGAAAHKLSPGGTPVYMAPEMAALESGKVGEGTDIYLLGAVLYEIVTGQPPHPWYDNLTDAVLSAARNEILETDEQGELVDIAIRAMQTDIEDRYESVEELQAAIREYRSHAESNALAEGGRQHLAQAGQTRTANYQECARAQFAFEEALRLWNENQLARDGLFEATITYAETAKRERDFSLGISMLDKFDFSVFDQEGDEVAEKQQQLVTLRDELRAGRRRHDRWRSLAGVASAGFLIVLITAAVGGWYLRAVAVDERDQKETALLGEKEQRERTESERDAKEQERERADGLRIEAERERDAKEQERERADGLRIEAERERDAKEQERERADGLRIEAEREKIRAQEASYGFEIGLADETLKRNDFAGVREIISDQESDEVKATLRDWEWGHLAYAATRTIETFRVDNKLQLPQRVESTAMSSAGELIVAGTTDGHVYIWDRNRNQKPEFTLRHGTATRAVAISPDGRFVASAGFDDGHNAKIWSLPQGKLETVLRHKFEVLDVAFSQDGSRLLTCSVDGGARVWDLADPGKPQVLRGAEVPVYTARFSPDGQRIVTGSEDGKIRIWSASKREQEGPLITTNGHTGPVYAAEFTANGRYVVSGGHDRQLLVWDLSQVPADSRFGKNITDELKRRLTAKSPQVEILSDDLVQPLGQHAAAIRSVSISGNTVVSGSHDNTVRVWDFSQRATDQALLKELRGHGGWVRSCAISDDGQWILSAGYDRRVQLWDRQQNYEIARVLREDPERRTSDDNLLSATHSPNGEWIVTASENGIVTVWDMSDPAKPKATRLEEGHAALATTGLAFAGADGARLLTAAGDNTSVIWDRKTGRQLFQLGTDWFARGGTGWRGIAAVSGDGRWIATGADDEQTLARIWNANSGQLVASAQPRRTRRASDIRFVSLDSTTSIPDATALAFSTNDEILFIGDENGGCYFMDPRSATVRRLQDRHQEMVTGAVFLPDGQHLLTASADETVARWRVPTGAKDESFTLRHGDRVVAMALSKDGTQLVTAAGAEDSEAVLRLWDVASGQQLEPRLTLADLSAVVRAGFPASDEPPLIRSVAWHPSGDHALVVVFDPRDSKYQVGRWQWDRPGQPYVRIGRGLRDISTVRYVDEDSVLTVGGRGARLWTADLRNVDMSYGLQRRVQFANFSHDGQLLVCAGSEGSKTSGTGSAKIWRLDPATRTWVSSAKLIEASFLNSAVFHPQRSDLVLTASHDGRVQLWRLDATGRWSSFASQTVADGGLDRAIFSPDGRHLLTMPVGKQATIWKWEMSGEIKPVGSDQDRSSAPMLSCAGFSEDGTWMAAANGRKWSIWQVDWDAGKYDKRVHGSRRAHAGNHRGRVLA